MPNYLLPFQFSRTKIKLFCDQFVDRGDPTAYDFTLTDFTTDGAWHVLDLSSIVPPGSSSVLFMSSIKDNLILSYIQFREESNANAYNVSVSLILAANLAFTHSHIVSCQPNSKIQYLASNTTFNEINLLVRGWWI